MFCEAMGKGQLASSSERREMSQSPHSTLMLVARSAFEKKKRPKGDEASEHVCQWDAVAGKTSFAPGKQA